MKNYLNNNFNISESVDCFDELPLWSAPFGLKLLDYIDYKPNLTALDIGFGTGFPLTELAMRLGDSSTVYGIDPWKEAIARTTRKINFYKISNIRLIEGEAENIPLEKNTIDLIVSNNGLNNVNDMDKVFSECSRIIKPGGQFVMTMNLDKTMFEFYEQFEGVLAEMCMNEEIDKMHQHIYLKRRPLDLIIALIQKHSFMINDIEQDQFNYKFTNGTAMLNHYFIRYAFMDSWIKILPPDKTEEIFSLIESRLNEQARLHGGIKLSIPFILINAIKS